MNVQVGGPLSGLQVVDFTTNVSGPFSTRILADLGARVIKVERAEGDDSRKMPPTSGGTSAAFVSMNRGKSSVVLDLKEPADFSAVKRLIASSDVLVENMRPGKMAKLGLGFDDLAETHPRLIYCSISGYGQSGPLAGRPSYDVVIQARTGIMSITGEREGGPVRVGPSIVDMSSGMWAATAICAALWKRDDLGRAQHLDISLYEAGLAWMSLPFAQHEMTGVVQGRMGGQTPLAAPADCYPTADGHLVIAVLNDGIWECFCTIQAFADLAGHDEYRTNQSRSEHRDALTAHLRERFTTEPTAFWLEHLEAAGVPADRISTVDGLRHDPQACARDDFLVTHSVELSNPLGTIALPLKNYAYESAGVTAVAVAPGLGEHTHDILAELK